MAGVSNAPLISALLVVVDVIIIIIIIIIIIKIMHEAHTPVDITWQYPINNSVPLVVGLSQSQVQRSGTRYQMVSWHWRSAATVSDNVENKLI